MKIVIFHKQHLKYWLEKFSLFPLELLYSDLVVLGFNRWYLALGETVIFLKKMSLCLGKINKE